MLSKNQKKHVENKTSGSIFKQGSVKKLIKEFLGLSPLEKKIYENLVLGKDKKALKIAKKKLGDIRRSRTKRDTVNYFLRTKQSS